MFGSFGYLFGRERKSLLQKENAKNEMKRKCSHAILFREKYTQL